MTRFVDHALPGSMQGKRILIIDNPENSSRLKQAFEKVGGIVLYPANTKISNVGLKDGDVNPIVEETLAMQPPPNVVVFHYPCLKRNGHAFSEEPAIRIATALHKASLPMMLIDGEKTRNFTRDEMHQVHQAGIRYFNAPDLLPTQMAQIAAHLHDRTHEGRRH